MLIDPLDRGSVLGAVGCRCDWREVERNADLWRPPAHLCEDASRHPMCEEQVMSGYDASAYFIEAGCVHACRITDK